MKIAILTTDNRDQHGDYSNAVPHFGTAPEALLQGFAMLPEVEVHIVSCTRRAMQTPEKIAPNLWYHPVLVSKIGWLTTGYQGTIRGVRKKLREIQPDLVHGQGTEKDCSMSAVFSGFPNVLTIHGNMRSIAKINQAKAFSYGWFAAQLERLVLPMTGGVVCITRYTESLVKTLAKRTWILPNAVDARFFEVCRTTPATPQFFVIGSICSYKNQNALIRALEPLAKRLEFRLVFLGSGAGEYFEQFRQLVEERPWCEWKGFANREALREHLATASALILPSLEDNCPMVVLEAMAAGVPSIAARIGGVPDLVFDGVNGLLCDPKSAESMSSAVEKFLREPDKAEAMGIAARKMAKECYHPGHIAQRHLDIYSEILGRAS